MYAYSPSHKSKFFSGQHNECAIIEMKKNHKPATPKTKPSVAFLDVKPEVRKRQQRHREQLKRDVRGLDKQSLACVHNLRLAGGTAALQSQYGRDDPVAIAYYRAASRIMITLRNVRDSTPDMAHPMPKYAADFFRACLEAEALAVWNELNSNSIGGTTMDEELIRKREHMLMEFRFLSVVEEPATSQQQQSKTDLKQQQHK